MGFTGIARTRAPAIAAAILYNVCWTFCFALYAFHHGLRYYDLRMFCAVINILVMFCFSSIAILCNV